MARKQVKVIIGARRGDEGKGLMTDYFCHRLSVSNPHDKILNVRFNGGAQAGHTVVRARDEKRHVFHHFGSGMLNRNVSMYYTKDFIMNPIVFNQEQRELNSKSFLIDYDLYMNKDAISSTPYDMVLNTALERKRGDNRHGSCGFGINETILRHDDYNREYEQNENITLSEHIKSYIPKRMSELDLKPEDLDFDINDKDFIEDIEHAHNMDTKNMLNQLKIVNEDMDVYERFDHIVFEGAQGLLLAKSNTGDAPHLTPSETGVTNILDNLKELGDDGWDIEICYVFRAYDTRHGAGPMEHECSDTEIEPKGLVDETNKPNEFQGSFRYGYIDIDSLKESIRKEKELLNNKQIRYKITYAVTHLDETWCNLYIYNKGEKQIITATEFHFKVLPITYMSDGPTRDNVVAPTENKERRI